MCLKYGFDSLEELGIDAINRHVYTVTRYLYEQLEGIRHRFKSLKCVTHSNGEPVVEIYGKHSTNNKDTQGGIVAFSLKRSDGSYIGYYDVCGEGRGLMRLDSNRICCKEHSHTYRMSL